MQTETTERSSQSSQSSGQEWDLPTLADMLKAGLHFGHQESRWNPKMSEFLFGKRNGIHIINLEITQAKLQDALTYIKNLAAGGGVILFVGTKKQSQDIVKREAERCGMPHVTTRWLGGTLTNFTVIGALIKSYNDLKHKLATGGLEKYTKLEQLEFKRKAEEMEIKVGGISTLERVPDALYIVDVRHEKTAYAEARSKKVPVVAVVDSNVDPTGVAYPIPGNDDSLSAIAMIVTLVADAVILGKATKAADHPSSSTG